MANLGKWPGNANLVANISGTDLGQEEDKGKKHEGSIEVSPIEVLTGIRMVN
jgi:hypothetical protein